MMAERVADHIRDGDAVSCGATSELFLQLWVEPYRLHRRWARSQGRSSSLAAPAEDLLDVISLLGFVGEPFDDFVGERCSRLGMSMTLSAHRSRSLRYFGRIGIAWMMTSSPSRLSRTTSSRTLPAVSGPRTSQRSGSSPRSSTTSGARRHGACPPRRHRGGAPSRGPPHSISVLRNGQRRLASSRAARKGMFGAAPPDQAAGQRSPTTGTSVRLLAHHANSRKGLDRML